MSTLTERGGEKIRDNNNNTNNNNLLILYRDLPYRFKQGT